MPNRNRQRQRTASQTPQDESIFDFFRAHRPEMVPQAPTQPPSPASRAEPVDYGREIAELRRRNEELERRLNETPIPRAATPTPSGVQPKDVRLSLDGLPDPAVDPEKYNSELQTRLNATLEAQRAALLNESSVQSQQQQQAAALWTQFSEMYPDWAADEEKVRFAAESVINAAKAKGLDTEAYITTHASRFCEDVARKLEQTFGPLDSGDETGDDDADGEEGEDDFTAPTPRQPRQKAESDDDDGRTAGIFGGIESGGNPARGKSEKKGDMISDLLVVQKASGFF